MRMNERLKKALSMLLCLCMLLQNAPVMAFAADTDNLCQHHVEHTAECGYAEGSPGSACTHVCGEACGETCIHPEHDEACGYIEAVEAQPCRFLCDQCGAEETTEPSSEATEPSSEATEPSSEATDPSTEAAPVEPAPVEPVPVEESLDTVTVSYVPETDLPDSDELFGYYADGKLYGYEMATFGTRAGSRLSGVNKAIYDVLKAKIEFVALSGGSTVFDLSGISGLKTQWTNAELCVDSIENSTLVEEAFEKQFDMDAIVDALLADCPFDLYWFDKAVEGATRISYQFDYSGQTVGGVTTWTTATLQSFTITFTVASGYQGGNANTVTGDVSRVNTAKAKAAAIVETYKDKTDLEKLTAYKNEICALTVYNEAAAKDDYTGGYGDPWQLIYVFDGDASTTVVCEGYSKAFQYLCDLGGLDCISVSGHMTGGTGEGGHMWNVVTLDGANYLVDVTNCDEGTVGAPDKLFMVGGTYANSGYSYTIGSQTITYTCEDLNLSAVDYSAQPQKNSITISAAANGTVTADKATAAEGETVTLTATPAEGYALWKLEVRTGSGHEVTVQDNTFTMPGQSVTVKAVFRTTAKRTVYFDNRQAQWGNVNIFFWSEDNLDMTTWPGEAMTAVEGNIYSYEIPDDAETVIFNNGAVQTSDQTLGDENCCLGNVSDSVWYTYPCSHTFSDGECTACGVVCDHNFDSTGKCATCGLQAVAKIGETYYLTLAQAAAQVTEGDTIDVFTDVTIGADETLTFAAFAQLNVAEGKTITCHGAVKIGEAEGIVFENTLYYHGGTADETWDIYHTDTPTYWDAGEGYAIFQPAVGEETAVLTLHNVTLNLLCASFEKGSVVFDESLTIRFSGSNHLTTTNGAVEASVFHIMGDTIMEGIGQDAELNLQGGNHEDYSTIYGSIFDRDLTVRSGTVNIRSGNDGNSCCGVSVAGTLTVASGAVLNAAGGESLYDFSCGLIATDIVTEGTLNALWLLVDESENYSYQVYGNTVLEHDLNTVLEIGSVESYKFSFSVPAGTSLTVNSGVTLDLSKLADIDFTGTVINNGTILLPADFALDNAPKSGHIRIGEKSYTWDSAKNQWICGENSHTGGTATCVSGAICTICGESYGEVDKTNHDTEKAEYDNGFCTVCDAYEPAELVDGVYQISNAGNLYWFADKVTNENAAYGSSDAILTCDIRVNEGTMTESSTDARVWTPIGKLAFGVRCPYTGTFEGNGKTISGLYFNDTSSQFAVGLFSLVGEGGKVQNVGIADSYFCGGNNVGAVVGNNFGTVTGCYNTSIVSGSSYVGGVVSVNDGTVTNCYNTGTVSGTSTVGGVMGSNHGTLTDCHNTGAVSGTSNVGGVVGDSDGTVTGCYNTGTVSGSSNVGGVVGDNQDTVTGCYNTGTVNGTTGVGGVAGHNWTAVTNCYNTGTVNGTTDVGGVAGTNWTAVTNCYNTGSVSGTTNIGGVVGYNIIDTSTVTNCYFDSTVYTGDAIGTNEGTATNVESKSTERFKSGEVAYLLSQGENGSIWGQDLDNGKPAQTAPTFTGAKVYYGYHFCGDAEKIYTNNSSVSAEKPDHTLIYTANGSTVTAVCSANCGYTGTVTVSATGKTYDGAPQEAAVTNAGLPETAAYTLTYTGKSRSGADYHSATAPKDAGDYTATLEIGGVKAEAQFTIEPKEITFAFKFFGPAKTYDGTAEIGVMKLSGSGRVEGDNVTCECDWTACFEDPNVGENKTLTVSGCKLGGEDAANYWVKETYTTTMSIVPRPLTITGATVKDVLHREDGNYTLTVTDVTFDNLAEGQQLTLGTDYTASAVLTGENAVGAAAAEVTVTLNNGNYTLEQTTFAGSVNIVVHVHDWSFRAEGDTITATCSGTIGDCPEKTATIRLNAPENLTYDGAAKTATVTQSPEATFADIPPVTYENNVNAGTASASLNYNGATANLTFTIQRKEVAEPTVTGTYVYTGAEHTATLTGLESCMTVASGNKATDAGTHEVTLTLDGNHQWAEGSDGKVQWTIEKAPTAISFTAAYNPSRVYNGDALLNPTAPYMDITGAAYDDVVLTWYETSVEEANKLDAAPKDAGTYYVVASIPDSANLIGSSATSRAITIEPMLVSEPAITLAQTSFAYDGTEKTPAVASVIYQGREIPASEFTVSYENNVNAGTATVTITDNEGGNFIVSGSTDFAIEKAAAAFKAAPTPNTLTYTGEAQTLVTGGETDHGTIVYSLSEDGTFTTTIPTGTDAGDYTVWYYIQGDENHVTSEKVSQKVTIAKAKPVISLDTTPITVTYGETVTLPTATATFGTVSCDKTAADLVNAGTYTVTYSVEGTANYESASKTLTVTVEKLAVAEPTVTGTYVYTGAEHTVTLTGLESCMTVASGNKATAAGTHEVAITLDGNHQWAEGSDGKVQWTIEKAQAVISLDTAPITVTYGETVTLPAATASFGTVVCDKTAADLVNAGTYTVTYTVAGTDNFEGDTESITVVVNAKPVTITADAISKTYGEVDPQLTYQVAGLVNGDELTGELKRVAGENVGSYAIQQNTLSAGSNYTITYTGANLTISAKAITAADVKLNGSLTYTGEEQTQPITVTAGITYTVTGNKATDVGNYELTVKGTGNYTGEVKLSWSIAKASVTITADNKAIYIGAGLPTLTCTVSGLMAGDELTKMPTLSTNANAAIAGTYTITAANANAGDNYEISYVDGTLTVMDAETEVKTKVERSALTEVPDGLKNTKFNTIKAITKELTSRILAVATGYAEENMVHYDVMLQFSLDGGKTWMLAAEENFPTGGITITLPYPDGTNGAAYDFVVSHMFTVTSKRLGTTAGDVELPSVEETADGIRVTLKGLSPVTLAWKATEFDVKTASDANGTVNTSVSKATTGTEITVTVTPEYGYKLSTLTVKDAGGKSYAVSTDNNGKYYFTMPSADVTVKATFSKISTSTADPTNPKTGDDFQLMLWNSILSVSAICLLAVFADQKRKMIP